MESYVEAVAMGGASKLYCILMISQLGMARNAPGTVAGAVSLSPGRHSGRKHGLVPSKKIAFHLPNSSHCHLPQMRHNDNL